ncbi:hypothetical protein M0813_19547 [Anaeramoeba flamelloides]|uniref:MRH domain-containing protein n=1 Tax=Anaeramoeba flamelloides TaxID=1746091 RepID=A0ABQ8YNP7_9EUKA|nr:hypothetical protein M0813_19547 [Anaeramoeba flamelloides]
MSTNFLSVSLILIVLLTFSSLSPTDTKCQFTLENHDYDFTSFIKTSGNHYYEDTYNKKLFVFNVCAKTNAVKDPYTCECCTPDKYSSITQSNGKCLAWGNDDQQEYSFIDNNNWDVGVRQKYRTYNTGGYVKRSTVLQVFCSENAEFEILSAFNETTFPPLIVINAMSKHACREPAPTPTPTNDPTFCKAIVDNEIFNLSPLKGRYTWTDKLTKGKYYLQICGLLTDVGDCSCCSSGVATGYLETSEGVCKRLGDLNNFAYTKLPNSIDINDGVSLTYHHKVSSTITNMMRFDFFCDPDVSPGEIIDIIETGVSPTRSEINFPSIHGCYVNPWNSPTPNPSPTTCPTGCPSVTPKSSTLPKGSGLSGGLVFLVSFLCGAATFVGGFFVHKYRKNSTTQYEQL